MHIGDEQATFWCYDNESLHTIFNPVEQLVGKKCILSYDNYRGMQLLNRDNTPSFYGMTHDEDVYLRGTITLCEDLRE